MNTQFRLDEKVALVTGATSGLGRQQAHALASAGASVILVSRRQERLDETVAAIEAEGGSAKAVPFDLSDRTAIPQLASEALACLGRIDILLNAAGVNLRQPVEEISLESWDQTINLNLTTPFFLARECVNDMQTRGWGRVINFASLQSTRAFKNGLVYGASKGGISQLTRAMAEAWSSKGINCNAIAPGFFPTELTAPVFDDSEASAKLAEQTAIGRNGRLEDIDGTTLFLASTASDYVTGQVIGVDGGFTAK